jgi:hypothetical protein
MKPTNWMSVIAHINAGGRIQYQAPFDYRARDVIATVEDDQRIRVLPDSGSDFDAFSADEGHLERIILLPRQYGGLHRDLTPGEERAFRGAARSKYEVGSDIDPCWHPVYRAECQRMNEQFMQGPHGIEFRAVDDGAEEDARNDAAEREANRGR